MRRILKCRKCGTYTLKDICPNCKSEAIIVNPPKYSPDDKYAVYRREVKLPQYKEQGLL